MLRNIKTEIKIKKFGSILLRILPFELSAVIVIVVLIVEILIVSVL